MHVWRSGQCSVAHVSTNSVSWEYYSQPTTVFRYFVQVLCKCAKLNSTPGLVFTGRPSCGNSMNKYCLVCSVQCAEWEWNLMCNSWLSRLVVKLGIKIHNVYLISFLSQMECFYMLERISTHLRIDVKEWIGVYRIPWSDLFLPGGVCSTFMLPEARKLTASGISGSAEEWPSP